MHSTGTRRAAGPARAGVGVTVALLVLTVACTPGGAGSPREAPSTVAADNVAALPDELTFTPETDAAGTGTVTFEAGGSVSATSGDGTTFELEVPARAVARDIEITMTPLADLTGITEEPGVVHAVLLEPEGLRFHELARLTITPAEPIPVEEQLMFEAAGDGRDAELALIDPQADEIVLMVEHFSVAGIASAAAMQRAIFLQKSATNAERRLSGQVAEMLARAREQQLLGTYDPDSPDAIDWERHAEEWQREVIDKLREAAVESCGAFTDQYMRAVMARERQRALLGTLPEGESAIPGLIGGSASAWERARYDECEKEAIRQCKEASDPAILIEFWIAMAFLVPPPDRPVEDARRTCAGAWDFAMSLSGEIAEGEVSAEWDGTFRVDPADPRSGQIIGEGTVVGEFVSEVCTVPANLAGDLEVTTGRFTVQLRMQFDMDGRAVVEGERPNEKAFFELEPVGDLDTFEPSAQECIESVEGGGALAVFMSEPATFVGPIRIEAEDGRTFSTSMADVSDDLILEASITVAD